MLRGTSTPPFPGLRLRPLPPPEEVQETFGAEKPSMPELDEDINQSTPRIVEASTLPFDKTIEAQKVKLVPVTKRINFYSSFTSG